MFATIAKEFTFDAAHFLPKLPADHKCHRMHGHTYRVELVFRGAIDANGFVLDYAEIAALWAPVHEELDHRVLNEIPGLETPSTEVLAWWIAGELRAKEARLVAIRVYESTTTWCEVTF